MPTSTATVRSASTVSAEVTIQTDLSAAFEPQYYADLLPFAHVVGDDEENRGQGCERDEPRQRGEREDVQQQRQGVDDAGDRVFRSRR